MKRVCRDKLSHLWRDSKKTPRMGVVLGLRPWLRETVWLRYLFSRLAAAFTEELQEAGTEHFG